MRLLVTGGAGFIGSNFIRYSLENHPEDQIVNFDVLTYSGNLENLSEIEDNPNYTFVKGDITDRNAVFSAMEGIDAVVHFAAETHVDRSIMNPDVFVRTNVLGTQHILDAVRACDIRYHHISTDEVFGHLGPDDPPFDEGTPYAPRSPYAASKAASDHLVRAYITTYGVRATISNCSNNYGPYMFPEKLIPLFISNLMEGKKIPVYGDGQQVRDWIHVDDHNRGVDMILRGGKIGETYCLGGGCEKTNIALTKQLIEIMGQSEDVIEFVRDRPGHDRRYAIDFSKARKELGWKPQITLDEGLRNMVAWYDTHQDWVARCKSGTYRAYYERQYGGIQQ